MPEPVLMKLGIVHIGNMASEPISTTYFINPSHQSVCLWVYPLIVARERLGIYVSEATNTQATIEDLLELFVFYEVRVLSKKLGENFFPDFLIIFYHTYISYSFTWCSVFKVHVDI
jgi:hypothetical protein